MAENQIISCPGCGKKYAVPPGVPPGQFQCQDCSSVVVYGQKPAKAGGGAGGKGGGSRKPARAAAAAKAKVHARRGREEEEPEEGGRRRGAPPAKKKGPEPMYLVMAGLLGLIVLGGAVYAMSGGGKKPEEKSPEKKSASASPSSGTGIGEAVAGAPSEGASGTPPTPAPSPGPAPAPAPTPPASDPSSPPLKTESRLRPDADKFELAANPATGGNYGKSSAAIQAAIRADRSSVITDLPHLPDTAEDQKAAIDKDAASIADPGSGSEALRALDRLKKIGRPAIPRVLSALAKCDFSKYQSITDARDPCVVADAVDDFMREVTGHDKLPRLQYTAEAKVSAYEQTTEGWFVWWLSMGYKRAAFERKESKEDE